MAFTGSAVVTPITDRKVRITGLTLAGAANGTIGLFGDSGAGVQLPEAFKPETYVYGGADVGLAASLECRISIVTDVTTPVPLSVTKGGDPFRITINNDTAATVSPEMEIWVEWQ